MYFVILFVEVLLRFSFLKNVEYIGRNKKTEDVKNINIINFIVINLIAYVSIELLYIVNWFMLFK